MEGKLYVKFSYLINVLFINIQSVSHYFVELQIIPLC